MLKNMIDKNNIKGSFPFVLKKGKFKDVEYDAAVDIVCENPLCTCQDLKLQVRLKNDTASGEYLYLFYINLEKKKISPNFKKEISPGSMEFAKSFIKEMEPDNWLTLRQFLFAAKMYIHDHADLEKLEVNFNAELIENELMVGWHEIFPFAQNIIKEVNGRKYNLDDQYCLRSVCKCTHTILVFINIENIAVVSDNHPACHYDYNKNIVHPLDGPIHEDIKKIMLEHGTELKKEFKKRHTVLRKLYRDYKKRSGLLDTSNPSEFKNVGRNDPCPCGSGKKFKKCCMKL